MNRVVLLSQQGNGTNLLRKFLSSHSQIAFLGEIFQHKVDRFGFEDYKRVLEDLYNGRGIVKNDKELDVIGFDMKYNQMNEGIERYIKEENLMVLHLLRDPARAYLRSFHENSNPIPHFKLVSWCKKIRDYNKHYKEMFSDNPYLEITYEDMTRGYEIEELPVDFEKRVLEWLGVKYEHMFLGSLDKLRVSF